LGRGEWGERRGEERDEVYVSLVTGIEGHLLEVSSVLHDSVLRVEVELKTLYASYESCRWRSGGRQIVYSRAIMQSREFSSTPHD
jgi:hypothetical protein